MSDVSPTFLEKVCPLDDSDCVLESCFLLENTASYLSVLGHPNFHKFQLPLECSHLPICPWETLFLERALWCGQPGTQYNVNIASSDC